jgi:hypothetical protein
LSQSTDQKQELPVAAMFVNLYYTLHVHVGIHILIFFLAHRAKGNVDFWHHLTSVVCCLSSVNFSCYCLICKRKFWFQKRKHSQLSLKCSRVHIEMNYEKFKRSDIKRILSTYNVCDLVSSTVWKFIHSICCKMYMYEFHFICMLLLCLCLFDLCTLFNLYIFLVKLYTM